MFGLRLRWAARDFRARWIQILATALVLAVGVGGFGGLRGLVPWRLDSIDASLAAMHAHDVRVDLAAGRTVNEGQLHTLARTAGVPTAAAQERLVADGQVEVRAGGRTVLAAARLVGIPGPATKSPIDSVALRTGSRGGNGDAVLDWNFAQYHELASSGTLQISGLGERRFSGTGVTPQHLLIVDDAGISGAEASLAVVYLPLADVQRADRAKGQVNELLIRLPAGTDSAAAAGRVTAALDARLGPGAATVTLGSDEPGVRQLRRDATNDRQLYTMFAVLLLLGAALAAFNLVSRVVDASRREIGIGLALGMSPVEVALRPLALGLQIGVLGALLGVPIGVGLASLIKNLMIADLPLPLHASTAPVGPYVVAASVSVALTVAAAVPAVWSAVRVAPVDAVKATRVERSGALGAGRRLAVPGGPLARLPLRNLLRSPRRTLMTCIGLGAAISALVGVQGMVGALTDAADRGTSIAARGVEQRLLVALTDPLPADGPQLHELERVPGVAQVEPWLQLPVDASGDGHHVGLMLRFVDPRSGVWTPALADGRLQDGAVVLSQKASRDLDVEIGDSVTLRDGERAVRAQVSGLHDDPVRAYAYTPPATAARFGLAGQANALWVVPTSVSAAPGVQRELFREPLVASVVEAGAEAGALQRTVEAFSGALQMVVFLTLGLGLLVAFTSASIALDEQRREFATMFAFGMPRRSALRVGITQSFVLGVLGTGIGLAVGYAAAAWTVNVLLSDTFAELGLRLAFSPSAVAEIVAIGVGAVTLAPLLTTRRLLRMDIPSTLRVRE